MDLPSSADAHCLAISLMNAGWWPYAIGALGIVLAA